jgi:hypothetical protein
MQSVLFIFILLGVFPFHSALGFLAKSVASLALAGGFFFFVTIRGAAAALDEEEEEDDEGTTEEAKKAAALPNADAAADADDDDDDGPPNPMVVTPDASPRPAGCTAAACTPRGPAGCAATADAMLCLSTRPDPSLRAAIVSVNSSTIS